MKTLCFDLDGTLCTNTFGAYDTAEPHPWAIERVNALARAGHKIIVFTARGTATGIDWDAVTRDQLARWGVMFDELHFGKPSADVYIDDRAVHTDDWRVSDAFSPPGFHAEDPDAEVEQLPVSPPPAFTTVVETGRTYGGRPLRLEQHAARAAALASAAGIAAVPPAADIEAAVRHALDAAAAGHDLLYAISVAAAEPALYVTLRPLDAEAAPAGELVLVVDGCLRLSPAPTVPSVPRAWLEELAAGLGLGATHREPSDRLTEADEAFVVGMPFCLMPLSATGPAIARLIAAWSEEAGIDVGAQTATPVAR